MEFQYNLPVNLIFGSGKTELLGSEAAKLGGKALIVTGASSTKKSGLLDRAIKLLSKSGVDSVLFDKVEQNPLTTTVYEGAELAAASGCDLVIGLGGGSIIDAAKAISFCIENEGDISEYIFGKKFGPSAAPMIAVPTTCGTGTEANCFAVLTNPDTMDKKSLRTPAIIPNVSIVDPELMLTLPKQIFASVGFDAFCHNMEAYIARHAQPFTDMMAAYALRLLAENLIPAYESMDPAPVEKVTLASTLGGMVINTAGVCAAHGMEHPVSGLRNVTHGKGLAALTPKITELSASCNCARFAEISRLFGGKDEKDCHMAISALLERLSLSCTLSDLGVLESDVDWLTENCMKVSAPSCDNNPRVFSRGEIREIYKMCL